MAGRRREYSEGRTARWGGEEGLDLLRHDEWSAGSSALFLTALAAVSQGLSFCYRVALSRLVGAEVMGLYQLLMPVCSVLLSLTAVGLTAAMSNLSSQYLALGNGKGVAQTRRMCLTALGVGLLPVSAAVVAFYDPISVYLLGDARTQLGLILLLPCVALTGVENIHKHFFYGTGVVRPPAVVELMEQFIRAAAVLGLFLPGPAALLALPAALPTLYVQRMADALAALPFAALSTQSVYLKLWLALVYVLLLLYLLGRGEKKRPLVPLGLGTAGLCAALVLQAASHTAGRLTVSVLDVGQGLSVALLSGGRAALVDCGGTGADNPGDTAADYFQSLGLNRIDLVVLTHYHEDHAGGIPELLERLEVGLLVLPDVEEEDPLRREITALAEEKGIETLFLAEDADVTFGESALRIYAPLGSGGANEEGLSVLCTAGDFDGLITGDMNDTVEKRLIKYGSLPDLELLVAGHHGSKYATSEELLLATTPELAVISVGYNTYGHPAPETLERLAAAGCAIYRTDWSGTVTITAK